ncbi:MAG: class I SAM-dependent methyltransferase [Elusimicrobiota bacterium]|jgi:predicted SAM-dependent methyltransferase|nr:class I SAM-dependent methyltransferase [Elusimicrobiota bacterium]
MKKYQDKNMFIATAGGDVEHTYSLHGKDSLIEKAVNYARLKIYKMLSKTINLNKLESIVDIGATADKLKNSSNFFEKLYPFPERITALSNQEASWLEKEYKGLKFVYGTALDMPFSDNSFDLVFSSAVIEHVGSINNQSKFIAECCRVSKKYVFITTPNRHYPIELHTALPLIHWLPKKIHRKILKIIGKDFFAIEENLNLLTKKEIRNLCKQNGIEKLKILTINFLGFPSNLLLVIEK